MDYDIFREELAIKYPAQGHALWVPSSGGLYSAVEVGDVGFIREGCFHRLFNVLLPKDHPSHENFGVPEHYEPLELKMKSHIFPSTLSPTDFRSKEVTVESGELAIFAAGYSKPTLKGLLITQANLLPGQNLHKQHFHALGSEVQSYPFQCEPNVTRRLLMENSLSTY